MSQLTSDNFFEKVLTTNPDYVSVVQFTANWCEACRNFSPMIEILKDKYSNDNISFMKVDIDSESALADRYNVTKLPTFLFFKDRDVIDFIIGAESIEKFKTIIDKALKL